MLLYIMTVWHFVVFFKKQVKVFVSSKGMLPSSLKLRRYGKIIMRTL